jgi:hypothetical protein
MENKNKFPVLTNPSINLLAKTQITEQWINYRIFFPLKRLLPVAGNKRNDTTLIGTVVYNF